MQDVIKTMSEEQLLQHGYQFHQEGKVQEANILYSEVINRNPNNHQALHLKGALDGQIGNIQSAITWIKKAIALCRSHIYYNNLANIYNSQGAIAETADCLKNSLACEANQPDICKNLILLIEQIKNPQQKAEILLEVASSYYKLERYQDAVELMKSSLKLIPNNANAYCNMGLTYTALGDYERSIKCYKKALKIEPDHIDVNQNYGQLLLKMGDFKQGSAGYRYRLKRADYDRVNLDQHKEWRGEKLNGKTLLILAEQGIGDEVMFSAVFEKLLSDSSSIIVEADERLIPTFQRIYPNIQFIPRAQKAEDRKIPQPFDLYCSAGEAFYLCHKGISDYGKYLPKLKACPEKHGYFQQRYSELFGNKRRIGIAWKSKSIINPAERSMSLEQMLPLLSDKNSAYINLQYGDVSEELKQFSQQNNVDIYQDPEVDPIQNIDNFLAQISAMDLVISIDNSTVHFSGALQKETHLLLSTTSDHRWLLNREDIPIYPSIHLYRQKELNNWSYAVSNAAQSLYI